MYKGWRRALTQDKERFLRRVPLFEGLEQPHLKALAEKTTERSFKKGEVLFFEGEPGDALYIVNTGTVKVYRVAEDGREKTLALLGAGEFFGEMALLDEGPRSAIAETLEPCELYLLHRNDFLATLGENPSIALQIIRVLSLRIRQMNAQIMDIVFRDVRGRVASTLVDLCNRHGVPTPSGKRIDLKLTHQELANLVGTARETVSRILAELQDLHCLTVDGRYLVLKDMKKLEEYAAGAYSP